MNNNFDDNNIDGDVDNNSIMNNGNNIDNCVSNTVAKMDDIFLKIIQNKIN